MPNSIKQLNAEQQLEKLIDSLVENWSDWEHYENEYLMFVIPNLLLGKGGTLKEREIMSQIKSVLPEDKIPELANIIKGRRLKNTVINNLIKLAYKFLQEGNMNGAIGVIDECESLGGDVTDLRINADLVKAERDNLQREIEKRDILQSVLASLESVLQEKNFSEADRIISSQNDQDILNACQELKTKFVQADINRLGKDIHEKFDKEKVLALAKTTQNLLVQARAGSGKTTLIALKVRQLVECYGAKPEEILVLAFNQKAANEFSTRINKYVGRQVVATKQNASTFHSLAWRLVMPGETLLFNDKNSGSEYVKGLQTEFIGSICDEMRHSDRGVFMNLLYDFLKALSKERKRGDFFSDDQYYLYRRNLEYVSLNGERVKSKSEKIIADFFFEHGLSFSGKSVKYEYEYSLPGLSGYGKYRPDFSLLYEDGERNPVAILEYFGVTERHSASRDYMTADEEKKYHTDKQRKLEYCKQRSLPIIEMSADDYDDLSNDPDKQRSQFEKKIQNRLEEAGFAITPLEQTELFNRIDGKRNLSRLFQQLTIFINRAKKSLISPREIRDRAQSSATKLDRQSKSFIKLAIRVYQKYSEELTHQGKIDFEDLLKRAAEKILASGGDCTIDIFDKPQQIKNIKWILIDEYQDFSELFYYFIKSIISINPSVSIFCVGDNWQAINSFAGSDLKYFDNFESCFPGGSRILLLINHRSDKAIVSHANQIMSGQGAGGQSSNDRPDGGVYAGMLDYVEWNTDLKNQADYESDAKYRDAALSMTNRYYYTISRYLKTLEKIVIHNIHHDICLLFRTNELYGVKIEKFKKIFDDWNRDNDFDKEIVVSTVHGYKGKESDTVVIVDANKRSYPKIHPDNELLEILGVSMQKVIEEERRLFYVAITRAKNKLYLLYEKDDEHSDFLSNRWHYLSI